jgi:UPF0755 protein
VSTKPKKRSRKKTETRVFSHFVLLVALAAAIAVGGLYWEAEHYVEPGPSQSETIVTIKSGTGLKQAAQQLADSGVIDNATLFRFGVVRRKASGQLKAGEYSFPAHASMADVLDQIVQGRSIQHRVTIAEGLTSAMAVALVDSDSVLVGAVTATPPEGSLLPETYAFERGATRDQLLARMRKAQADLLAVLWPARKAGLPFATIDEALTLASIVEKETAAPAERSRIAAVFINRLRKGMKLEADPTIIYGLTQGYPLGHSLRQSELAKPNPYSTYQIAALPPTPICNPGRDAIAAALNPPDTNELFFVADGHGGHVFAATAQEHAKNVAKLRTLERNPTRGGR